jgi:hypothetical protein
LRNMASIPHSVFKPTVLKVLETLTFDDDKSSKTRKMFGVNKNHFRRFTVSLFHLSLDNIEEIK